MNYSKPIDSLSKQVTITSTPQTVSQMLVAAGGAVVPDEANAVTLYFYGTVATPAIIARASHDPLASPTIASTKGIPILSFDPFTLSREQFDAIFVAEGADIDAWVEIYDREQLTT